MPKTRLRLAVLIDADNVSLKALTMAIPAIDRLGTVAVCRIFGNLPKARRPDWAAAAGRGGLPLPCFVCRTGKNAADFALTIQAVDLLHAGGIDGACLLSSDGDFVHVVRRLRAGGLKVHVFGSRTAAKALQRAADRFHAFECLAVHSPVRPPEPRSVPPPHTSGPTA